MLTVSDTYYLWPIPIRKSCGYNLVLSLLPTPPPPLSLMLIFFGHNFTTELHIISYHEIYSRTYLDKRSTIRAMLWKLTELKYKLSKHDHYGHIIKLFGSFSARRRLLTFLLCTHSKEFKIICV